MEVRTTSMRFVDDETPLAWCSFGDGTKIWIFLSEMGAELRDDVFGEENVATERVTNTNIKSAAITMRG